MGARKQLVEVQALTGSVATYYTAPTSPANVQVALTTILLANSSAADHTATVHLVPAGGSAAAGNQILPGITVKAHDYVRLDADTVIAYLGAGGMVQALCSSAGDVNLAVAGEEIS